MKKLSFEYEFLFVSIVTYFFNLFFLFSAFVGGFETYHEPSSLNVISVIFLLFFSYYSFRFGMDYKKSFVDELHRSIQAQIQTADQLKASHDRLHRIYRRKRLRIRK